MPRVAGKGRGKGKKKKVVGVMAPDRYGFDCARMARKLMYLLFGRSLLPSYQVQPCGLGYYCLEHSRLRGWGGGAHQEGW